MDILTPLFWTALLKIIGVNIILSGDNAVVIALAARSLAPAQQKQAIFWGSAAAIVLRILLTFFAVALLQYAWLKLVGSALLVWIGENFWQMRRAAKAGSRRIIPCLMPSGPS